MGRKPRIDLAEMAELRVAGRTYAEMAAHFGVTTAAINGAVKRLTDKTPGSVLREAARVDRAAANTLDAAEECLRLRAMAQEAFDVCKVGVPTVTKDGTIVEAPDWSLALRALERLQKGLDQWLRMAEMLHDFQAVQEFQVSVLEAVADVAPEVRDAIVAKLADRRSLRLSATLTRGGGCCA